jgi:hypothetical protein
MSSPATAKEQSDKIRCCFYIPASYMAALERWATEDDRSASAVVRTLIAGRIAQEQSSRGR